MIASDINPFEPMRFPVIESMASTGCPERKKSYSANGNNLCFLSPHPDPPLLGEGD